MLVAINRAGSKPPVFFIHGASGIMPIGGLFSRVLGPDQPFYVINAKGFDGSPPHQSFEEMVQAYYDYVLETVPAGPVVIAAMCWGTLIGIDVARKLLASGRELGPVVLFDPPRNPFGGQPAKQDAGWGGGQQAPSYDPSDPLVERQLYNYARGAMMAHASIPYNEMPFDARDPKQLEIATRTAIACTTALSRYSNLAPFFGAVELVINANVTQFFFGRQMPWQKLLPNPHATHVYPYGHIEWFRTYRFNTGRLFKFILDGAFAKQTEDIEQYERSLARAGTSR
jgi:pimeloyl-ACP methyl ester carboxylesterase